MKSFRVTASEDRLSKLGVENGSKLVDTGTLLFVVRGMSLANEFRVGIAGCSVAFNQDLKAFIPTSDIEPLYLAHFLRARESLILGLVDHASHGTARLTTDRIENLLVPIPPLGEQRRIADILDRADALRAKRRAALARLDELSQAIFDELFGDPAINPKRFPCRTVGELGAKFSDGPFGSNLKSAHYTENGIRVIRLQNIGAGSFLDNDRAFISQSHFKLLKKHECKPGDVLIGTLGDPNLRACVQPDCIPIALNKADCVQLRPNDKVANASFVCGLLNHPSTERMAQGLILGQTRSRISMGRLRNLRVPVPPMELQASFANRIFSVEKLALAHRSGLVCIDTLFSSLQDRAFRGSL